MKGSGGNVGTRERYLALHQSLAAAGNGLEWIHPTARIGRGVTLEGATVLGAGSVVGDGATLRSCILWKGAKIASGSFLERCIITAGKEAGGEHSDADF